MIFERFGLEPLRVKPAFDAHTTLVGTPCKIDVPNPITSLNWTPIFE